MDEDEDARACPRTEDDEMFALAAFIRMMLVMLLRAGLADTHACLSPEQSGNAVLQQHLLDFAVGSVSYWLLGYTVAFGESVDGMVGTGPWAPRCPSDWALAVQGWCSVLVATALTSCVAAGRLPRGAHAALTAVHAGLLHPLLLHWTASTTGWLDKRHISHRPSDYKDLGGAAVIHTSAGVGALVVATALGRQLPRDAEPPTCWGLAGRPPPSAGFAYAVVSCGLVAAAVPVPGYADHRPPPLDFAAVVATNSLAGASGAVLAELALQSRVSAPRARAWAPVSLMQAGTAGIVVLSAGADVYIPAVALGLGVLAGVVHGLVYRLVLRSDMEDPVHVTAVHLSCGVLSCVLPPLLGSREMGPGHHKDIASDLAWQLAGLSVVIGTSLVVYGIIMGVLAMSGQLRSTRDLLQRRPQEVEEAQPPEAPQEGRGDSKQGADSGPAIYRQPRHSAF